MREHSDNASGAMPDARAAERESRFATRRLTGLTSPRSSRWAVVCDSA
jgi:hypothetical protein